MNDQSRDFMRNQVRIQTDNGHRYYGVIVDASDFYSVTVKIESKGQEVTDDDPYKIGKTYEIYREEVVLIAHALIPDLEQYIMDRYDEDTDTDLDEGVEITDGIVGEDIEEQKKVLQCDGTIVFPERSVVGARECT